MPSRLYQNFVHAWAAGAVNPTADALWLALVTPDYVFNTLHTELRQVQPWEAKWPGYLPGGLPLKNVKVRAGTVMADPVLWGQPVGGVGGGVLYRLGGMLVAWFDLPNWRSSDCGIEWANGALFTVKAC